VAAGDLIVIAVLSSNVNTATFTWPSGFTQQGIGASTGNFAHSSRFAVAVKRATASEPASYTVTVVGGPLSVALAASWTGRSNITFTTVTPGGSNSGTNVTLNLSGGTAAAGDDIAWLGMGSANGAYTASAPTSYTSQATAGPGGNFDYINLSTRDNVSAGATGTISGSYAGSTGIDAFGIVISLSSGLISGATSSSYTTPTLVSGDAGSQYYVAVSDTNGSTTSSLASLALPAPSISQQPTAQHIRSGQSASFSVTATGLGTFAYQWYANASIIGGATSSSYNTGTVTQSANGTLYSVTVTNANGTTTSSTAWLDVSASGQSTLGQWDPTLRVQGWF
jgi:hypothetical protein